MTFYLNYSVFLHDTLQNTEEAIKISKNCLYDALRDTEEIVDNSQKDIVLLCQMLKDNISLWKTEFNDNNNNEKNEKNETNLIASDKEENKSKNENGDKTATNGDANKK